jgi:hypothetical protein
MNRYPGNHVDSGIVTVPRNLKTRPGAPETHLAYITPDEERLLQKYKPGTPHRGPEEIPNYDTWSWDSSGTQTGGSTADTNTGNDNYGYSGNNNNNNNNNDYNYNWETSSNPWGDNYVEPYKPPEEVYKDPLPEDIVYDDKIADYSFSTPDVRSSIMDKIAFRKRIEEGGGSGWSKATNAETLAGIMYDITNNPNYLNQPILVPHNADWKQIWGNLDEAMQTGNLEIFFEGLEGLEDITAGNPNTQYFDKVQGTGFDDWYRGPKSAIGNNPGGHGYGYGYGNRGSRGYGSGRGSSQREIDPYNPEFGKWGQSTVQGDFIRSLKNRGGIISIVR